MTKPIDVKPTMNALAHYAKLGELAVKAMQAASVTTDKIPCDYVGQREYRGITLIMCKDCIWQEFCKLNNTEVIEEV